MNVMQDKGAYDTACILEWLAGHPQGRTTAEYSAAFGVDRDTARYRFKVAKNAGLVALVGANYMARWVLPEFAEALHAHQEDQKKRVRADRRKRQAAAMRARRKPKPVAPNLRQRAFEAAKFKPCLPEARFKPVASVWELAA